MGVWDLFNDRMAVGMCTTKVARGDKPGAQEHTPDSKTRA